MSGLDEAKLGSWLRERGLSTISSTRTTKFSGGQSNPTYRVEVGVKSLVLRRKPFGPILASAHAVEREYRLIAALHPTGFPVPRPHALCEDAEVIGAPFYVMDLVVGRTLWDGALPGMAPAERTAIYHAIIDTLAALHSIDPAQVGLSDFGRPGNYFARQVERWTKQYRASQTDDLEDVERLIEWLPRTVPEQQRTSIVHGDFRIDNMIFDADRPEIRAVIDWELATLGDPLADLSYFLMSWVTAPEGRAGVKGLTGPETGIPTIEAMAQRYCAATGRDGVPALDWYFAYNQFRLAGIVQGIKKRMLDGNASSAHAAATVAQLPALARSAWSFAERAGA
ncbi:phosphotransferase family protein [Sphingomonas sp. IC-56]|uniref:phosphotransferase family protein n=1 Tax=Sphingomonas sp. IC-56 TaxID=2898529 RepID=UPI001E38F2C6|nr:phosphotransferase family protein [Sphingomonas sp. IC-56]MCD2323794.1 phosphotransferase family protein [Sphingomonas sp. IC-56]